jgi:hypothetical protein
LKIRLLHTSKSADNPLFFGIFKIDQIINDHEMFNNVITSDNCLPFFILYHYFLSSSTINCVNLRSDPEFKLISTDVVLDFESITQHPDNKDII